MFNLNNRPLKRRGKKIVAHKRTAGLASVDNVVYWPAQVDLYHPIAEKACKLDERIDLSLYGTQGLYDFNHPKRPDGQAILCSDLRGIIKSIIHSRCTYRTPIKTGLTLSNISGLYHDQKGRINYDPDGTTYDVIFTDHNYASNRITNPTWQDCLDAASASPASKGSFFDGLRVYTHSTAKDHDRDFNKKEVLLGLNNRHIFEAEMLFTLD